MGPVSLLTQLVIMLTLHVAGGGMVPASDLLFTSSNPTRLPTDNQTYYTLSPSEVISLELNAALHVQQHIIFITISPCTNELQWAFYQAPIHKEDSGLILIQEHIGADTVTFAITTTPHTRYILQIISGTKGGGVAISVRGEEERLVRLRLRMRSRKRLLASWEPSPIDPKSTTYCVVVSQTKNYTSLCAAQADAVAKDPEHNKESYRFEEYSNIVSIPESIDSESISGSFEENHIDYNYIRDYRSVNGKKNRITGDPIVACVGTKTHYYIENLDFTRSYYVSVFAVGRDRPSGSLLAVSNVDSKTSDKILKESVPYKTIISEKTSFYFKTYVGTDSGLWLILKTCGGAIDMEVLVRGKRLFLAKSIDPYTKIFVPTPRLNERSSWESLHTLEWTEERKIKYVIKVTPSRLTSEGTVGIELTASQRRWGADMPELQNEGKMVRELRPLRSCTSVDIAFLPAVHNATDVIRYCISASEYEAENTYCLWRAPEDGQQCIEHMQRPPARVLIERVTGLKPGRKYTIQLSASSKGSPVPYNFLYVDTNPYCKSKLKNQ